MCVVVIEEIEGEGLGGAKGHPAARATRRILLSTPNSRV